LSCTAAKRIQRQETLEVGPEMNWLNIYSSNPMEEKNVIFVSKESLIFNFFRNKELLVFSGIIKQKKL